MPARRFGNSKDHRQSREDAILDTYYDHNVHQILPILPAKTVSSAGASIPRFEGARLKLERASKQIAELKGLFENLLSKPFCEIAAEDEPNDRKRLVVRSTAKLPEEAPVVVGDVVHNIRSALDQAMVQVLGRSEDVYFPFGKTREDFERHKTFRWIKDNRPVLATFMETKIVAHDTGGPSIWAASRLNNEDKHNWLVPHAVVKKLAGVRLETPNLRMHAGADFLFDEGGVVNFASVPGGPITIIDSGTPQAALLFAADPLKGQPIIPALEEMIKQAQETISELETFASSEGAAK